MYVRSGRDTLPCTCKMAETPNCPESRESESSIEQASAASGSSTDSSSSKSLLDVLKAPTLVEIARKRAVRVNLPPSGKRQCRGASTSDPKGVDPLQRIKCFTNEPLTVSGGQLFCLACREVLGLKMSTLSNHIRSNKHVMSKTKMATNEARERDIASALSKHNEETHM